MRDYNLLQPVKYLTEVDKERAIFAKYTDKLNHWVNSNTASFNIEQEVTNDKYTRFIETGKDYKGSNCQFCDAFAGRGKSFMMNIIVTKYRAKEHIVIIIGTSALSIQPYARGRTAHSFFEISIVKVSYLYYRGSIY